LQKRHFEVVASKFICPLFRMSEHLEISPALIIGGGGGGGGCGGIGVDGGGFVLQQTPVLS
jgi:hypothetical protein